MTLVTAWQQSFYTYGICALFYLSCTHICACNTRQVRTVEIRRREEKGKKRLRCMLFMLLINNYINFLSQLCQGEYIYKCE